MIPLSVISSCIHVHVGHVNSNCIEYFICKNNYILLISKLRYLTNYVFITDKPGPPSAPEVTEIRKTSCTLSWQPPEEDGGTPVIGYLIERATSGSKRWLKVSKEVVPETTLKVTDLIEDTEYQYRIIAVNKVGEGEPGPPSEPFGAKDPWGEFPA